MSNTVAVDPAVVSQKYGIEYERILNPNGALIVNKGGFVNVVKTVVSSESAPPKLRKFVTPWMVTLLPDEAAVKLPSTVRFDAIVRAPTTFEFPIIFPVRLEKTFDP
jgi:hypothetical protein